MAAFVFTAIGSLAGAWVVLEDLDAPIGTGGTPAIDFGAIRQVRSALSKSEAAAKRGRSPRIVFLGDSTATFAQGFPNVVQEFQRTLRRSKLKKFHLSAAAYPMMTPIDYFYAVHEIADSQPDAVVATVNLGVLGSRVPRTDMAGMIPASSALWAQRYPLHKFGLTFDRLLLASAIVQTSAISSWRPIKERQTRLGDWRTLRVQEDLDRDQSGKQRVYLNHISMVEGQRRADETGTRHLFGDLLDGVTPNHPMVRMLEGTVSVLRERGIVVVLYVNPVNIEWFDRVGLSERKGLHQTIAVIRAMVEGHGGTLVDLHEMLPDAGFKDAAGHMHAKRPHRAAHRIAKNLAYAVIPLLVDAR